MKTFGYVWGIGGVVLLLLFAIYRLAPMALALENSSMTLLHYLSLVFSIVYMAYAEGYKGFYQAFAPRVVVRAAYLRDNPRLGHVLLAPLFCMGYIYATPKRRLMSFGLTLMIVCFIIVARMLPQPWRGILDAGVVTGLSLGIASIIYFLGLAGKNPGAILMSPEIPVSP